MIPDKKKQHFVPKFYLRHFSNNYSGTTIGIFNINKEIFIPEGDLRNQAYIDYFYGKDGKIEAGFEDLETKTSAVFRKIIGDQYVPKRFVK